MSVNCKLKLNNYRLKVLVCAIAGVLSMNPYFLWPTFMGGALRYLSYTLYLLSAYFMYCSKDTSQKYRITREHLVVLVSLVVIYFISYWHVFGPFSLQTAMGGVTLFMFLFGIVTANPRMQIDVFEMFIKVLVVTLIPGLVYYLLELLGISLSIGTIYSKNQLEYQNSIEYSMMSNKTNYYKLYIGAVMRVNTNTRFSGIYDEAGLVGTVTALCLVARGFKLRGNKLNFMLLVFNLFTFSLAGYLLIAIYFFLKWIRRGQWKLVIGGIFFFIFMYLLLNANFNSPAITFLQNRLVKGNGVFSIVNNRETSHFAYGYNEFLNSGLFTKLLGFGRGADSANAYMSGSSSYKCLVYNYGYFGFGLMMVTLLYLVRRYFYKLWRNWPQFSLIMLFGISIYQRPSVYSPYYFIILLGGCSYLYNQMRLNK